MTDKITKDMLLQFIKKNISGINKIDKINLNSINLSLEEKICKKNEITPLGYQSSEKITFLPRNIIPWFNIKEYQYYHIGVLENFVPRNVDYDINISLFASILTCLTSSFSQQPPKIQSDLIHTLIMRLKKDAKKKFNEFNYRNKDTAFTHHDLINELNNGIIGGNLIRYIADYFHINIFILDIEENEFTFGNIKNFIPFKKSIFLIKYNQNKFEPLFTNKNKYFCYNDDLIEIIIDNINDIDEEIEVLDTENLEKYIVRPLTMSFSEKKLLIEIRKKEYKDKLKKQMMEQDKKENIVIEEPDEKNYKSEDESTFEEDIDQSDDEQQDYNKMKLEELRNVAKKLKISLTDIKTKSAIIKEITKKN